MVLLAGALHPRRLSWRIGVALCAVLLFPFLTQRPDYVLRQYGLALEKFAVAGSASVAEFRAADLTGILAFFGLEVPVKTLFSVRAIAGVATLAVSWLAMRRWAEPRASILLLAMAAGYLMVFNPRTESNTYVVLSPVVAVFAAWALLIDRRPVAGAFLAAACLGFGSISNWLSAWFPPRGPANFIKPALALSFLVYAAILVAVGREPGVAEGEMKRTSGTADRERSTTRSRSA
jgi:hypothetical protein